MTDTMFGLPAKALVNSRVAVIDGDSFAYIIGYNHRERDDLEAVTEHVDDFIHNILQSVQCRYHIGVLNPKQTNTVLVRNFRTDIAKAKPYKGQRPDKPEWYVKWAPIIEDRLITEWGFKRAPGHVEADDLVASLITTLSKIEFCTPICCGCDKDLKQLSGHHYDYKKNVGMELSNQEAIYKLFGQVLEGDTSDNIGGLPGLGKVGVATFLADPEITPNNLPTATLHKFISKLGMDQGIQSFYENYMLCKLRCELDVSKAEITPYDLDVNAVREMSSTNTEEVEEVNFIQNLDAEDSLFSVD